MKHKAFWETMLWICAALPLAATAALYPLLPEVIPIHWNASGEIDGWGPRSQAFILAAVCLGVSLLLRFLPLLDPKRNSYRQFSRGYFAVRLVCAAFFCLMQGVTLASAFHPAALPMDRLTFGGMGLVFCVMGNFMPKFKHGAGWPSRCWRYFWAARLSLWRLWWCCRLWGWCRWCIPGGCGRPAAPGDLSHSAQPKGPAVRNFCAKCPILPHRLILHGGWGILGVRKITGFPRYKMLL